MKFSPIQGPGGGSIVCDFILHCKRLFSRFEPVTIRLHNNNFTVNIDCINEVKIDFCIFLKS